MTQSKTCCGTTHFCQTCQEKDAEIKRLKKVTKAAVLWWMGKRPLEYSLKDHLANPNINCCSNDTDRELAISVGRMVAEEKDDVE